MAADNYSDVVQALAQQIVNACSKMINAKAPGLISSANIDASQITGDTTLINAGSGGSGGGIVGPITVDKVVGLNQAIATAIASSAIDVNQIVSFDENVGLVIKNTKIETAQINELSAYVADIAKAHIGDADINWATIQRLTAEIARIANAQIGTATIDVANIDFANIDWAKIKNSVTDRAIITQGVSGQLYIADLAVTEANMVSLTVGELIVRGNDGGFYALTVNDEGGITTVKKQVVRTDIADKAVDNGKLADGSVNNDKIADASINGDAKMIAGSITAKTLNARNIFAENALIKELMAANLDVDTLFAREATISNLNAIDITGNEYLQMYVGDSIDNAILNITPNSIAAKVMDSEDFQNVYATRDEFGETLEDAIDGIVIGSRNYIRNSRDMILDGVHELMLFEDMNAVGYAIVGVSNVE